MTARKNGSRVGLGFWAYVEKTTGCWIWTGSRDKMGYGRYRGVKYRLSPCALAHRISWLIEHGSLDPSLCVLHRCDNPPCVRPDHLFLGTKADNTEDMITKGRGNNGARPYESRTHGTRNAQARINEEQAVAIRKRVLAGERQKDLASEYRLSVQAVNAIVKGRSWRHVWPYSLSSSS